MHEQCQFDLITCSINRFCYDENKPEASQRAALVYSLKHNNTVQ